LTWLTPSGYLFCVYSVIQAVLMGVGRSAVAFRLVVLGGVLMNIGVAVGSHFGIAAVAIGVSVGTALIGPFYFWALARALRTSSISLMLETAPALAASAGMLLAIFLLRPHLAGLSAGLQLASCIGLGAVTYGAILAVLSGRKILTDLRYVLPNRSLRTSPT
ncbi:MAG: polysaccharide transporter, family, partial [Phenylobacterium sp.]|nr:polysaccharide transporter, family [Phenylobacterium sp.]